MSSATTGQVAPPGRDGTECGHWRVNSMMTPRSASSSHAPAASASPRGARRRRRLGLAHRERSLDWVTIMPIVGVAHVTGLPVMSRASSHACGCHAARGRRGRWSLVGRMFNPTEQQWLLGTGSTPDRPCSRGAPRPITPDTLLAARSEPFSRHAAPRVADGPRHRPRRSWRPWLGSAAKQAKPAARPSKVRRTSRQAPKPEPRPIGEYSVYISTAERHVLHP